jgi:chorismate mutase
MLRGVRGATTVTQNDKLEILSKTSEMLTKLVEENHIATEDIGAVIFSSTPDINSAFPAAAARSIGWSCVPLFGTQEIDNPSGVPFCVRVLLLWNTKVKQQDIKHIYLGNAAALRPDIAAK